MKTLEELKKERREILSAQKQTQRKERVQEEIEDIEKALVKKGLYKLDRPLEEVVEHFERIGVKVFRSIIKGRCTFELGDSE